MLQLTTVRLPNLVYSGTPKTLHLSPNQANRGPNCDGSAEALGSWEYTMSYSGDKASTLNSLNLKPNCKRFRKPYWHPKSRFNSGPEPIRRVNKTRCIPLSCLILGPGEGHKASQATNNVWLDSWLRALEILRSKEDKAKLGLGHSAPKGPRTQIIGFEGPNTINIMVFGP